MALNRAFGVTLLAAVLWSSAGLAQADGESGSAVVIRGWEWWKSLSEAARIELAPKLVEAIGRGGAYATTAVELLDNTSRYRALCAKRSGVYRDTALCRGLQYSLTEPGRWSRVFSGLVRRAGTSTAPAREAAAILAGLQRELGLARRGLPARNQYLIRGLYDQFGRCSPPTCQPGLQPGELRALLTAATEFALRNGADDEVKAAADLQAEGWKQG